MRIVEADRVRTWFVKVHLHRLKHVSPPFSIFNGMCSSGASGQLLGNDSLRAPMHGTHGVGMLGHTCHHVRRPAQAIL